MGNVFDFGNLEIYLLSGSEIREKEIIKDNEWVKESSYLKSRSFLLTGDDGKRYALKIELLEFGE